VETIETMGRIIHEVETNDLYQLRFPEPSPNSSTFHSDVVCYSAVDVAERINAKVITGITVSGYTAFKVSSRRPKRKICIFSGQVHILATLNLVWGVKGYYYDKFTTTDETIEDNINILKATGEVGPGDVVVNIGSMPLAKRLRTNMLRVTVVE